MTKWRGHENQIFDVFWSPDDQNIITTAGDRTVNFWDAETQTCISQLKGHLNSVKTASMRPDNSRKFIR